MASMELEGASEKDGGVEQGFDGEQRVWQGERTNSEVEVGFWGGESTAGLSDTGGGLVGGWDLTR